MREASKQTSEQEQHKQAALELAYLEYQKRELDDYIQFHFSSEEWEALMETKKKELLQQIYWKRIFAGRQNLLDRAAGQLAQLPHSKGRFGLF